VSLQLLASYIIVTLARDGAQVPPFVMLTTDRKRAETEARRWAEREFGPGGYSVVETELVTPTQQKRWRSG
jgi:hypothetical protein